MQKYVPEPVNQTSGLLTQCLAHRPLNQSRSQSPRLSWSVPRNERLWGNGIFWAHWLVSTKQWRNRKWGERNALIGQILVVIATPYLKSCAVQEPEVWTQIKTIRFPRVSRSLAQTKRIAGSGYEIATQPLRLLRGCWKETYPLGYRVLVSQHLLWRAKKLDPGWYYLDVILVHQPSWGSKITSIRTSSLFKFQILNSVHSIIFNAYSVAQGSCPTLTVIQIF